MKLSLAASLLILFVGCFQNLTTHERSPALPSDLSAIFKTFTPDLASIKKDLSDTEASLSAEQSFVLNHTKKEMEKYPPKLGVHLRGHDFYLSDRLCSEKDYVYALMYTKFSNQWYARLLYRSKSNGLWRSTSGQYLGGLNKGLHYTQDHRLDDKLEILLNTNYAKNNQNCLAANQKEIFNDFLMTQKGVVLGVIESKSVEIPLKKNTYFNLYENGKGFNNYLINNLMDAGETKEQIVQEFFSSMDKENFPEGFYPDFAKPLKKFNSSHTIFSKALNINDPLTLSENIVNEVFTSHLNKRPVEWTFSYVEGTKEPWISRIHFADSKISSYGGDEEVILSGPLTLKPIEYFQQTAGIDKKYYRTDAQHKGYVDIRPFLQNFPPIVDYKHYKDAGNSW